MYSKFPREMSFPERAGPYRVVYNESQFNEAIHKLNGKKNIFTSVYSFSSLKQNNYQQLVPDYGSAIIDRLFFDFDSEQSLDNIKKLHAYLLKNKIMHTMIFSGGGFHLYIFCNDNSPIFPYDCVENAQRFFCNEVALSIGDPQTHDIDEAVIGDLARVSRIPYTYNLKRKKWCIPITHQQLLEAKDIDYFKELAGKKLKENVPPKLYGENKLDIKTFDYEAPRKMVIAEESIPLLGNVEHISDEHFWPCIENMIVKRSGCYAWYWATIFFREKGYTKKETEMIMEKYLSKFKRTDGDGNDFLHYKNNDRHLDNVYSDKTGKHWWPSATHLFKKGLCPGKCQFYKEGNCLYFNGNKGEYQ